jgi:biotin synthase-related radical SAM superfamily protein
MRIGNEAKKMRRTKKQICVYGLQRLPSLCVWNDGSICPYASGGTRNQGERVFRASDDRNAGQTAKETMEWMMDDDDFA